MSRLEELQQDFYGFRSKALQELSSLAMSQSPADFSREWKRLEESDANYQLDRIRGRVRDLESAPIGVVME